MLRNGASGPEIVDLGVSKRHHLPQDLFQWALRQEGAVWTAKTDDFRPASSTDWVPEGSLAGVFWVRF